MAEQDFEPIEVLVLQIGKDTKIDPVLGKTLRVLPKPEPLEPVRNLQHGCIPATDRCGQANIWTTAKKRYPDLSVHSMC